MICPCAKLWGAAHPSAHQQCYDSAQHRRRESRRLGRKRRAVVQAGAMNNPRTWNRRDFTVTANGFFTILKPSRWFSAVPLPGGFRYLVGRSKRTSSPPAHENPTENPTAAPPLESTSEPTQKSLDHADGQETAILSQSMIPGTLDHRLMRALMRAALIVFAAIAITCALLWFSGDCDHIFGFLFIPRG